jgi:type III restriction enzyme
LRGLNPYEVGSSFVSPGSEKFFSHAVHKAYDEDDFNSFEALFAEVLDKKKLLWCRNPARSGYSIPLPTSGKTLNFFPDFLVWKGADVFAIDTKGSHLHTDAVRKLVAIKPATGSTARVFVRFVSDGVVDRNGPQADSSGYTAWTFKPNGDPEFTHVDSLAAAIDGCIEPDL